LELVTAGTPRHVPLVLALSGGSAVFLVIILLFVAGLAYTVYSKSGSGIDAHPLGTDAAPGSGHESGVQDPDDTEFRQTFDDRGSR
jgi:hypothetical protein